MKKFLSLSLALLSFSILLAQSPKGKWIVYADGRVSQIEFKDDSSLVVFTNFKDIRDRNNQTRAMRLPIIEVEKQKDKSFKYTVQPKDDEMGLIYLFNQEKNRMRIFVKERFRDGETIKTFTRPPSLGIQAYKWSEVEKIMKEGKDPDNMSREDILDVLETFKKQIIATTGGEAPKKNTYDQEVYLFNYYFDILIDKGYNIFENDKRMNMGIDPYKEDPEVKKLMDEIEEMIEGKKPTESDTSEGYDH